MKSFSDNTVGVDVTNAISDRVAVLELQSIKQTRFINVLVIMCTIELISIVGIILYVINQ